MSSKFIIDSMLPKYHTNHQNHLSATHHFQGQLFPNSPSSGVSALDSLASSVASSAVNYSTTSSPAGSSPNSNSTSSSAASPAASAGPASLVANRMYPYVSAATAAAAHHHHQQQQAVAAAAFGAAASGGMVPGFPTSAAASSAALAAAVDAAAADKSCRYTAGLTGSTPADSMVNYTLGHHHQNGVAAAAAVSAANSVSAASASMAAAAQFYAAQSGVVDPLTPCNTQPGATPGGQPIPDIPRYPWMSITGKPLVYHIMLLPLLKLLDLFQL